MLSLFMSPQLDLVSWDMILKAVKSCGRLTERQALYSSASVREDSPTQATIILRATQVTCLIIFSRVHLLPTLALTAEKF